MGLHGSPWQGSAITSYLWCAIGAMLGLLAGAMTGIKTKIGRIETVLVGVFGAFIGGDFLSTYLTGNKDGHFTIMGLAMAITGAVVMLFLLKLMRGAVGPMRISKSRAGKRY